MLWRGVHVFLGCLNLAVVIMAGYFLAHGGLASIQQGQGLEYKDFVSILLTALAVMIAIFTVFIAAAAFWGFNSLKDEAQKEADKRAAQSVAGLMDQIRKTPDNDIGVAAGSSK